MSTPIERTESGEKAAEARYLAVEDVPMSPSESREAASRLVDDLELLRAERLVSREEHEQARLSRSKSRLRTMSADAFRQQPASADAAEQQHQHQQQQQQQQQPPHHHHFHHCHSEEQEQHQHQHQQQQQQEPQLLQHDGEPSTVLSRLWVAVRKFPRLIRYLVYMTPVGILLLTPILLDLYALGRSSSPVGGPGGVRLLWFGIWLETVWLSLWVARIFCAVMPSLFGWVASAAASSNAKKWRDIGGQLEFDTALFLWMLAVLCSYMPIIDISRDDGGNWAGGDPPYMLWIDVVDKVIIALFVLAILNFAEKILIQWIATSFHMRTYAYRIESNKRDIQFLVQLYDFSRNKAQCELVWDGPAGCHSSTGTRTPLQTLQANARHVWGKVGSAANRMAGDFTGRKILKTDHPQKVVLELLRTTPTSHTLARMIYRTFVRDDRQTITPDDMAVAFASGDEADACFAAFDKDLNGDVSMEELEMVCNEIHLEKKAIAASLKDLDSVIRKLDRVFVFIVVVIAAIVFVSIISGSAAAALGSAGTTILGLAWMLQATAQEFLQSIIFVFVKHPFDVGDRVTVYGNTGSNMRGDDYYVQEVSLLYTEFKKMEGHVVQAPNSLLNELFILNQRRSNGLADPIELKMRFGTAAAVIDELKARMLDFVMENKRDYAPRIITELRTIEEVWAVTINFIFFHKTNYQNELLRLQRHNKFATELMRQMADLGIEGPRKMQPGGTRDFPFYWAAASPPDHAGGGGATAYADTPPAPGATAAAASSAMRRVPPPPPPPVLPMPSPDLRRRRAESRAAVVDAGPDFQDVYDSRRQDGLQRLQSIREPSRSAEGGSANASRASMDRLERRASTTTQRHRAAFLPRHGTLPPHGGAMV